MDSILNSTKKTLGIQADYLAFDPDIIMFINSTLSTVAQLGVGPSTGFVIEDENDNWSDISGLGDGELQHLKNFVYMKVRLGFDPPQNSFTIEAIERQARELEFRLNVSREEDQWTDPEPPILA